MALPELEEELLLEELLDDDELLLEAVRPELELLEELVEDELLAAPSGPLQAARVIKLRINRLRVKRFNACMAGSCNSGVEPAGLIKNRQINFWRDAVLKTGSAHNRGGLLTANKVLAE